jgi:flagellum-specific ATP synthase
MTVLERFAEQAVAVAAPRRTGQVRRILGLNFEVSGIEAAIGDAVTIHSVEPLVGEVVAVHDDRLVCMPLGELRGVRAGDLCEPMGHAMRVPVGSGLLGRVLDGLGRPLDGLGPIQRCESVDVVADAPHPLLRKRIDRQVGLGVRVLDSLMPCGRGQRMGIFAGSGVGKSTMLSMIARNTEADVSVIALIGERGREVREFIENDLGPEGLARSVVVVATSEQPALVRLRAAFTATRIAEYFRDQGNDVVLMMDSLTRFAMAQREVGLSAGEPPATRGYPPSVFALLPKLLERAGAGETGSITGLYTVLVEGDDMNEPIGDAARSILDGHVVLSRKLASSGHYPCVDVLESLSRVMPAITTSDQRRAATEFRRLMAAYREAKDLIEIGAYIAGANPVVDRAVERREAMDAFLQQRVDEPVGDDLWNAMAMACGMPPLPAAGFVSGSDGRLGAMGAGGMSLALPGDLG